MSKTINFEDFWNHKNKIYLKIKEIDNYRKQLILIDFKGFKWVLINTQFGIHYWIADNVENKHIKDKIIKKIERLLNAT